MDVYKLAAILSLEDRLSGPMGKAQGAMLAAGAAVAGAGLKIGADWDRATDTIIDGTGATGVALESLQGSFQAVARHGPEAAGAIADLNTHLGLMGPGLELVADAALKAGANTNLFGDVASQLGLDAGGAVKFLDQLKGAAQQTGVDIDTMTRTIGKNAARWQAAGGSMEDLTATVIQAADEFGPAGLKGAMSEILEEVDKGLLPAVQSLETTLGDTTGAVERTYEASRQWRDVLGEVKNAAIAYLGPAGDMLAGVGSLTVGVGSMLPAISKWNKGTGDVTKAQKALNLAMKMNPIGLVIAAVGALVAVYVIWSDEINAFLKGAWNAFLGAVEGGIDLLRPLAGLIGVELPDNLDSYKFATDEAAGSTTDAAAEIAVLKAEAEATAPVLSTTLATAVETVADEIEAFNLEAAKAPGVLAGATTSITTFKGYLEANTAALHTGAVAWGFYVDEAEHQVVNRTPEIQQALLDMAEPPPAMPEQGSEAADAWAAGFFASLQRSFEGGGGYMGGIKSSMVEGFGNLFAEGGALSGVADKWGEAMEAIGGIPVVGPFLKAFGPALIGGVVALGKKAFNALKGLFGGPSEAVQQARGDLDAFGAEVEDRVGQTASSQERFQDLIANGWEHNRALVHTFFQDQSIAAGRSAQEGNRPLAGLPDGHGGRQHRHDGAARAGSARLGRHERAGGYGRRGGVGGVPHGPNGHQQHNDRRSHSQ